MSTTRTASGAPSFIEIGAPSGGATRDFYQKLFGWTFDPMGTDNFAIQTPTIRAGVHAGDEDRVMVIYFAVDDIDAAVGRVRELGGSAEDAGPQTEGFGRFAQCRDAQGIAFGLHQAPRA